MISAVDALLRLKEGNLRFLSGNSHHLEVDALVRSKFFSDQNPFAIILGCSDSRVPAEIVFGQGIGDLFVIRVAGNVVAPSQIASIEFAAEKFETRLVVVLGHSMCGAVLATLDQLEQPSENRSPHLHSIVDRIRPAIEPLLDAHESIEKSQLIQLAVRANIEASVNCLRHGSQILESLIAKQNLLIVPAEYCLETGVVAFLEDSSS